MHNHFKGGWNMDGPLIPDVVEVPSKRHRLILSQLELWTHGRKSNEQRPRTTTPNEVLKAIALLITPCSPEPRLQWLSVRGHIPRLIEMGGEEGVDKFMRDGAGEHKDQAGMGGDHVDVFAFVGGDAGHALQVVEPVVFVWSACFFDQVDLAEEFDVAVVHQDGGLSCVSAVVVVSSLVSEVWSGADGSQGPYALAAGMQAEF